MFKKKHLALILAALAVISLSACGRGDTSTSQTPEDDPGPGIVSEPSVDTSNPPADVSFPSDPIVITQDDPVVDLLEKLSFHMEEDRPSLDFFALTLEDTAPWEEYNKRLDALLPPDDWYKSNVASALGSAITNHKESKRLSSNNYNLIEHDSQVVFAEESMASTKFVFSANIRGQEKKTAVIDTFYDTLTTCGYSIDQTAYLELMAYLEDNCGTLQEKEYDFDPATGTWTPRELGAPTSVVSFSYKVQTVKDEIAIELRLRETPM